MSGRSINLTVQRQIRYSYSTNLNLIRSSIKPVLTCTRQKYSLELYSVYRAIYSVPSKLFEMKTILHVTLSGINGMLAEGVVIGVGAGGGIVTRKCPFLTSDTVGGAASTKCTYYTYLWHFYYLLLYC